MLVWCSLCCPSSAELCTAMVSSWPSACSPLSLTRWGYAFHLHLDTSMLTPHCIPSSMRCIHPSCNGLADMHALTLRQMRPQRSSSGSAFVTDTAKRHIMTNSHVVSCNNPTSKKSMMTMVSLWRCCRALPISPFGDAIMRGRDCHGQATASSSMHTEYMGSKAGNDETRASARG